MAWFKKTTSEMEEAVELILSRYSSEHTRKAYRAILEDLSRSSGIRLQHIEKLSRADAMRFLRECGEREGQRGRRIGQDKKVLPATIKRKHLVLKNIFKELGEVGYIPKNPFDFPLAQASSAPQKRPTKPLPFEKVLEICDMPEEGTPKGVRDRAILATLFGNGGRRGELKQILLGNVNKLKNGGMAYHIFKTKGGRSRTKYLPPWAATRLETLIAMRLLNGAADEEPVFIGKHGGAINGSIVYRLFKKYVELAGLDPKEYSPHSARATMATYLEANGASIKEIMEVGGWASSSSAERYIKREFDESNNPAFTIDFSKGA